MTRHMSRVESRTEVRATKKLRKLEKSSPLTGSAKTWLREARAARDRARAKHTAS